MVGLACVVAAFLGIFAGLKALAATVLAIGVVSPLLLVGANDLLKPVEKNINRKYYNEAASILLDLSMLILGLTIVVGKEPLHLL